MISQVVVGLIFSWFYAPNFGLFYKLIEWITGTGIAILADPTLVTYGIIAAGLWPQIAYCMILYLTGLNNVSPDQIEAARLDGAKGFKMLWYVILPQLRPATFIAVVVTVIGALRSFDLVSIMTDGGPFGSSRVLSSTCIEQALSEYGYRMGYGASIAVVLFLIMMVFISGFIWKMVPRRDARELTDVSTPHRTSHRAPSRIGLPDRPAGRADPLAAAAPRRRAHLGAAGLATSPPATTSACPRAICVFGTMPTCSATRRSASTSSTRSR